MLSHTSLNSRALHLLAAVLLAALLLTACASKAERAAQQIDLGQKYLTESNYEEALTAFTAAIKIDPKNVPAYMGRAEAYRGLEQYEDAKANYSTAIELSEDQPYTQATAYVGRAEVNELTEDNSEALSDYESASASLDKVEVEKLTDVTEQMLEALKIKVYAACARLNALLGRHEAAVTNYTKALDSLEKLPDNADILNVPAEKISAHAGRAASGLKLEQYETVLEDYDALIELGENKSAERDTLLSAISLAKSKAADLNAPETWLDEVNHADFAEEISLNVMNDTMQQAAALAAEKGEAAYLDIKAALETEQAQQAMRSLLARGYQLRYYDADGKMLSIYAGETSWPDVSEEQNGLIEASALEQPVQAPTEEELAAVSLKPLYVYYGSAVGRSREGEGVWYIIGGKSTDLTAKTYDWEQDKPKQGFEENIEWVSYTNIENFDYGNSAAGITTRVTTISYGIGGKEIIVHEEWTDTRPAYGNSPFTYDTTFTLSNALLGISKQGNGANFQVSAGTTIIVQQTMTHADGSVSNTGGAEVWSSIDQSYSVGRSYTIRAGEEIRLNYAGVGSYWIGFIAE